MVRFWDWEGVRMVVRMAVLVGGLAGFVWHTGCDWWTGRVWQEWEWRVEHRRIADIDGCHGLRKNIYDLLVSVDMCLCCAGSFWGWDLGLRTRRSLVRKRRRIFGMCLGR